MNFGAKTRLRPKTIVKPTALGTAANTDTKLLIYGLFQKGRVLAQDAIEASVRDVFNLFPTRKTPNESQTEEDLI